MTNLFTEYPTIFNILFSFSREPVLGIHFLYCRSEGSAQRETTIKVQWDQDKKFTFRLHIEKFCVVQELVEESPMEVPIDIFQPNDEGDY